MNPKLQPGGRAPDFALPAVDGKIVRLRDALAQTPVTVVLFICNHCPYVLAYIPRLIGLQREFSLRLTEPGHAATGVGDSARSQPSQPVIHASLIGICSNDAQTYPEDGFDHMKQMSQQWGLNFPYLRDEDQSVARAYGVERTPEVFLMDQQGICRYEGGIDDHYQDASKVTQRPLRDAILAVGQNQPVPQPQSYAIGCSMKWKKA